MKAKSEKKVINIRGIECPDEVDAKYNKWFEDIHVPMLFKAGEVVRVTRYKRIGDDKNYPKYLAVYEFADGKSFQRYEKSPELAAALAEVKESWPQGGYQSKWRIQYEAFKTIEP